MPYELKDRQHGFMNAVGLLLKESQPDVRDAILETLANYGDGLREQIVNGGNDNTAADEGVNPCGSGQYWNPGSGSCEPLI